MPTRPTRERSALRASQEPPTQANTTEPHDLQGESWTMERNISARLAVFEKRLTETDSKITALAEQFMLAQLHSNEAERDMAHTTIERMEASIQQIQEKREALAKQKAQTTNQHDKFMLDIMDDVLLNRLERTEAERDQAVIKKEKAQKGVNESQRGIKAVKSNTTPPGRWDFISKPPFAGVIQALLLLIVQEIIRSWIIPLMAAAFAK